MTVDSQEPQDVTEARVRTDDPSQDLPETPDEEETTEHRECPELRETTVSPETQEPQERTASQDAQEMT